MNSAKRDLPDFERPPVVEVTLSAQFDPLTELRTPHLGLFWAELRNQFPFAEERPPLAPAIETFGRQPEAGGLKIELVQVPPVSRCWFISRDHSELIQLQQDRFVVNWRKTQAAAEYPRYEHVRQLFLDKLDIFRAFLTRERLGSIKFSQCEVTYVNHFPAGLGWERPGQIGELVTVWNSDYSDAFLSEPEDVRFSVRYVMRDEQNQAIGRLHISAEPRYSDDSMMLVLVLNTRGKPMGEDVAGVVQFFDEGRKWIVRGFTSITTGSMHKTWGRRDNL